MGGFVPQQGLNFFLTFKLIYFYFIFLPKATLQLQAYEVWQHLLNLSQARTSPFSVGHLVLVLTLLVVHCPPNHTQAKHTTKHYREV